MLSMNRTVDASWRESTNITRQSFSAGGMRRRMTLEKIRTDLIKDNEAKVAIAQAKENAGHAGVALKRVLAT